MIAELTFSGDGSHNFKPVRVELKSRSVCVLPVERISCVIPYSRHPIDIHCCIMAVSWWFSYTLPVMVDLMTNPV